MRQRKTIIWGLLLILAGVLVALCAFEIVPLPINIAPWRIICGLLALWVFIDGLSKLDFVQTLLMLGVEIMIFEEAIGTLFGKSDPNWISNGVVILVAILVGAGLDMIFKGFKKRHKFKKGNHFGVEINAFSHHLKYIDASKLNREHVKNTFGEFEIRFENADEYCGGGVLTVENTFGETVIHVPSDWEVEVDVDNIFGEVNVDDSLRIRYADGSDKNLTVKGTNRFGELEIRAYR